MDWARMILCALTTVSDFKLVSWTQIFVLPTLCEMLARKIASNGKTYALYTLRMLTANTPTDRVVA